MTARAPATNRLGRYRSPCLLMLPSRSLPPLECCLGTSPIQAEKLRPDRKVVGSATLATRAVATRLDTAKIGSAGRVEVHHARLPAVIGVRKTFPHGLGQKRKWRRLNGTSALPRWSQPV